MPHGMLACLAATCAHKEYIQCSRACLHHTHMHVRSPPQHTHSTQSITTLLHVLKYKHMPYGQLLVRPKTARHAVLQLQHTTSALCWVYKCVVQCLKTCNCDDSGVNPVRAATGAKSYSSRVEATAVPLL